MNFQSSVLWLIDIRVVETIALAQDVVDVDVLGGSLELFGQLKAFVRWILAPRHSGVITLIGLHCFIGLSGIQRVPVGHLHKAWGSVVLPVRDTVSDHHTFEVWSEGVSAESRDVVMVDLVDEIWDIDAGIRFTCDVEFVGFVVSVFFEPQEDGSQIVLRNVVIIPTVALIWITAVAISDTSWLFDVKDICFSIPTVVALFEGGFAISDEIWTILLKERKHRRATWTTIKPNDQRVSGTGFLLTLNEQIVDVLIARGKVDITRVHAPILLGEVWVFFSIDLIDSFLLWESSLEGTK